MSYFIPEAHSAPTDLDATEPWGVSKEHLYEIAISELDFEQLCRVLNLRSCDVEGLRFHYQQRDQRCYSALDMWKRRGPSCKRKFSELFQVLQALNRPDLIQKITSLKGELLVNFHIFFFKYVYVKFCMFASASK